MTPSTITRRAPAGARADLGDAADLGVARSYQQKEVPEPKAQTIQHDLHQARCACGKTHTAPRPPGVPDSAVSIGPRLCALAVYLLVFQHVPVERCLLLLLSDVAPAGGVRGVHPLLPGESCVDGSRDREADQGAAHRGQGRGVR